MEILAIIPARGGSKGIPNKNIVELNGRPLIEYTIRAAHASRLITRTILSTDSQAVRAVGRRCGVEIPFVRPAELATDKTPALPVIRHAIEWLGEHEQYAPDYIVLLQPTSPLRTAEHIDAALTRLIESNADSIVSVVKVPHNFNPYSVMKLDQGHLTPFLAYDEKNNLRQLKPVFYGRNGAAIYAFTTACLLSKNSIYGDTILAYEMDKAASVDIDDEMDLQFCEFLMQRLNASADG